MIEALLVVSLVFGGWNWLAKEKAHDTIEDQKLAIESRDKALVELDGVIEGNESVLDELEESSLNCQERYENVLSEVNEFKEVSIVKDAAIKQLSIRLRGTSFASCRVPDGITLD